MVQFFFHYIKYKKIIVNLLKLIHSNESTQTLQLF
jgi:hypothetical protein